MKAIYGLPESMRLFVDKLKKDIMDLGFVQSRADPALYILKEGDDFMWLPTVVDDLYPVYTSEKIKQRVFDRLAALYRIDDRGELRSTQGIRIDIDIEAGIIKLDQQQFKENLLAARNLLHCKSAPTPALTKQGSLPVCTDAITKEELEMRGNWPYRSARDMPQLRFFGIPDSITSEQLAPCAQAGPAANTQTHVKHGRV